MAPTPQDLSQALAQSRLPALDWIVAVLPDAAALFIIAAGVAVLWLCWTEFRAGSRHLRQRRV